MVSASEVSAVWVRSRSVNLSSAAEVTDVFVAVEAFVEAADDAAEEAAEEEIGRASCRERVCQYV